MSHAQARGAMPRRTDRRGTPPRTDRRGTPPRRLRPFGVRRTAQAMLAALAAALLASCGPGGEQTEGKVLLWGIGTEIQGLDPHIVTGVPENRLMQALCEGLLSYNPKGGEPIHGVAESYEVSGDGMVYTFKLRENARWWNGDPVTAHDYVWSWQRILTPALGSQYTEMLYPVKNAEAFYRGRLDDFSQVGVRALDAKTLQVRLERPTPYFPALLPHYSTYAVHRDTVLAHGEMTDRNSPWTRPGNFVCNGPFRLQYWRLNDRIAVERNPLYWDAANVKLDGIHYFAIESSSTEEQRFRQGRLHITATIPLERIPHHIASGAPQVRISPLLGTYFYRLNTTRPPLDDVRVRRALAYSIDRKAIVERVSRGGEQPAQSFTPPGVAGYTADTQVPFDPALARRLLREAGYGDPSDFPVLELLYNTSEGHRKIAAAVQEMWREHLGIEVALLNQDWKVYLERNRNRKYDISRAGWVGDYPDPTTFLNMMVTDRGNNNTGFSNAEYDALLERSATQSGERRLRTLRRAERILMDQMPLIPIYIYTTKALVDTRVQGYDANILDVHPPRFLDLLPQPPN